MRQFSAISPLLAAAALALLSAAIFASSGTASGAAADWVTAARGVAAILGVAGLLLATHLSRRSDAGPTKLAWVMALLVFVLHSYVSSHDSVYGWTGWIQFGGFYEPGSLPALKATPHRVLGGDPPSDGYDGQFYAQVALDPLLLEPRQLDQALENPCYRARRVLVPALSHVAGLGDPPQVLRAFVLLHGAFWLALAVLLVTSRLLAPWGIRAALLLVACCLSCGATTSMGGCLPDLPAAVLIMASLVVPARWGPVAIAVGALARDTGLLGVVGLLKPKWSRPALRRNAVILLVALLPVALWFAYSAGRLRCDYPLGIGNVGWPFVGIAGRLLRAWREVEAGRLVELGWRASLAHDYPLHDFLTVISIMVQMAYVVLRTVLGGRRGLPAPLERIGLAFVGLGLCLGEVVWDGTGAAARVLLPLCIVFNLMLLQTRRRDFAWLFVLGNLYALPGAIRFYLLGTVG